MFITLDRSNMGELPDERKDQINIVFIQFNIKVLKMDQTNIRTIRLYRQIEDIDSLSFAELKNSFIQLRQHMMKHIHEQDETIRELKKQVKEYEVNNNDLTLQLQIAKEKVKQLIAAKYQS